jgi:hypothetical protein
VGLHGDPRRWLILADLQHATLDLKPFRPNEGRYQLFIFAQKAMVRRAEQVVDSDAVLGERKQRTPIEDARSAKDRSPFDHQATALR